MFFNKIPAVHWDEIEKGAKIIDVREIFEYKKFHAKGTKNVPLSSIENYKDTDKVYVTCASGNRSSQAVKYLRSKGVDAINIKGGMMTYVG